MKIARSTSLLFVLLVVTFQSAGASSTVDATDRAFIVGATQSNLSEIAAGKLAIVTSASPRVRALGRQLVDDHTSANAALKRIARAQGVPTPALPSALQRYRSATFKHLTGAAFDAKWLLIQETGHEQTVGLFRSEIASGANARLVSFAKANLPTIEAHLIRLTIVATSTSRAMPPIHATPLTRATPEPPPPLR